MAFLAPLVSRGVSTLLRSMAERTWARAGAHGDRAFLVVAGSFWNAPRISQHDVARTLSQRGPTVFLEPSWVGRRDSYPVSFDDGGPTVVAGPAIPRGIRWSSVWRTNLKLGVATWRALADAAPPGRRLLTWVLDFRLVPAMDSAGFRPSFLFHNVDIQTDGVAEGRMAQMATLCACPSSAVADLQRRVNPRTIAIGHGITGQVSDLSAAVAQQRASVRAPTGVVGFVGLWNQHVELGLVRRMLGAHPALVLDVTAAPEATQDIAREFPGRVRPLGFLPWPRVLEHAASWDAAVVPYDRRSPNIQYSCPYKLNPLLAAAIPVICVDIPGIRGLAPHLYLTADDDEFVTAVGRAIRGELRVDPTVAATVRAERAWDRILDRVIAAYDDALLKQSHGQTSHAAA
jgi:hypothetical protein